MTFPLHQAFAHKGGCVPASRTFPVQIGAYCEVVERDTSIRIGLDWVLVLVHLDQQCSVVRGTN